MLSIRVGQFDVSFLPKDKEPIYNEDNTWSRRNRQTGKPGRIFQKLLKKEFKTRDWEIFTNLFKSELCDCANFELVEGEDIRKWYLDENYYLVQGTLGNSCMRHSECQPFFDVYVDNAKMLITTKDGLLTGRAIVWQIGDITILDRIYTCYDYLENCFIDYAKEHKWWIRENNSLLSSGDDQYWLTPDDDYNSPNSRCFSLTLSKSYDLFPYMDSFRYFDNKNTLYTCSDAGDICLDNTDGSINAVEYECASCGRTFYGSEMDAPEELHWSEYDGCWYCDDCCWYCNGLDDYIGNDHDVCSVFSSRYYSSDYPSSYVDEYFVETPNGTETSDDIVKINDDYYFVDPLTVVFNLDTNKYEIRSDT